MKPFATNFTNIPPSYGFMLYIGAIVFTFFDIPSSNLHKGAVNFKGNM